MRLNPDCVRDILIALDEKYLIPDESGFVNPVDSKELLKDDALSSYQQSEILHTIRVLFEVGILDKWKQYVDEDIPRIKDLNQTAYSFLDQIKPISNWEKIKDKLIKSSSVTIPAIIELAKSFIP